MQAKVLPRVSYAFLAFSYVTRNLHWVFVSNCLIIIEMEIHYFEIPGVNFINVLWAAFTHKDPQSAKKTVKLSVFFVLWGSSHTKAARKTLMKLTPELSVDWQELKLKPVLELQGFVCRDLTVHLYLGQKNRPSLLRWAPLCDLHHKRPWWPAKKIKIGFLKRFHVLVLFWIKENMLQRYLEKTV